MPPTTCSYCGAPVTAANDAFCGSCGSPLQAQKPTPAEMPPPPAQPPAQPPTPSYSPPPASYSPPPQQQAPPPQQPYYRPLPAAQQPKKRRGGCSCFMIGLLVIGVIVLCLGGLFFGALFMMPELLEPYIDIDTGSGSTAPLVIQNNYSASICYVYISESSQTNWGPDQLAGDVILSGNSYVFYMPVNQSYDVSLYDCNSNLIGELYNSYVSSTGYTITAGP